MRVNIFVVQAITGEFVLSCGSKGTGLGQFNILRGLTLTPDEMHLLICDSHRVVVADARDGRSLRSLHSPAGILAQPMQAIVVPQTRQVLVLEYNRNRVVVFAGVVDDTVVRRIRFRPAAVATPLGPGRVGCGGPRWPRCCGGRYLEPPFGLVACARRHGGAACGVAGRRSGAVPLPIRRDGDAGAFDGDRRGLVGGG